MDMPKLAQDELAILINAVAAMIAEVALTKQGNAADAATQDKLAKADLVAAARQGLAAVPNLPSWFTAFVTDEMLHALADPLEDAAQGLLTKITG